MAQLLFRKPLGDGVMRLRLNISASDMDVFDRPFLRRFFMLFCLFGLSCSGIGTLAQTVVDDSYHVVSFAKLTSETVCYGLCCNLHYKCMGEISFVMIRCFLDVSFINRNIRNY